tara:strand:+ start:493 stop:657 length:165 start_codon:yes stop_codon:yes gene_type:complete
MGKPSPAAARAELEPMNLRLENFAIFPILDLDCLSVSVYICSMKSEIAFTIACA